MEVADNKVYVGADGTAFVMFAKIVQYMFPAFGVTAVHSTTTFSIRRTASFEPIASLKVARGSIGNKWRFCLFS